MIAFYAKFWGKCLSGYKSVKFAHTLNGDNNVNGCYWILIRSLVIVSSYILLVPRFTTGYSAVAHVDKRHAIICLYANAIRMKRKKSYRRRIYAYLLYTIFTHTWAIPTYLHNIWKKREVSTKLIYIGTLNIAQL